MFASLKKLFGHTAAVAVPPSAAIATPQPQPEPKPQPQPATKDLPFLRREAIFDRDDRLSGHLFYLRQARLTADGDPARQGSLDQILLDTLNASPEAWNTQRAFIPLSSSSLSFAAVDQLKTANIVLLIQLAAEAEAGQLCTRISELRQRGLQFGLFRQPRHPLFSQVIPLADYAVIDIAGNEASAARDFSAAARGSGQSIQLLACNIETPDDHRFCRQWHYSAFHGKFASAPPASAHQPMADPHKALLLNLLRLVQNEESETAEIAEAMKHDPLLSFRILRYLNSPALGLSHHIDSLSQALIILGRQRLSRWLAVLLFSVREPKIDDWLLIETALTRGRLMEILGEQVMPGKPHDPLFLTGIFSCLERLLRRPLPELVSDLALDPQIRQALLEQRGPYAPILAVALACENTDQENLKATAQASGLTAEQINRAQLSAIAWASEVTEYWE